MVVLGSGTCVSSLHHPFDFRNPSGHLLQFNGVNILLDCGEGMHGQMNKLKFDHFDLNYIFITHFHPDHFNLDSLIQSIYVRARKGKIKKSLKVYGPKTIEERFRMSWDSKHSSGAYEKELLPVLDLKFFEYADETEIKISNAKVIPYKVLHKGINAYALRFLLNDKIVAYSGDSGVCGGLEKAAQNADIFICEAAINMDDNENNPSAHLTYSLAGDLAKKSNVKKLVLVHYSGKDSNEVMEQEVKRSGFLGEIKIAKDLDSLEI